MKTSVKRLLHSAGSILAFTGIIFVAYRLNNYNTQVDFSGFDAFTWSIMIGFIWIYGLANIILALAWRYLLIHFGEKISRLWALKTYGLTQLAKYVPGNIMHLASRQAIGLAAGVSGWPLAKASVWELGLISIAAAFFSILVLPQFISIVPISVAFISFVTLLLIMAVGLKLYVNQTIAQTFGLYIIFLIISGIIFVGLLDLIRGKFITPLESIIFGAAFIIAWLTGLVTPGAPAGIGVREFMLVMLLNGLIPESDLLLAVLLSRIVTVGGDVLFFLFASFFLSKVSGCR